MRKLIVTADDFGMARSINEGIAKAVRDGIVTCVNFLPAGEAFEDAARLARELKIDQAGAHLALTEVREDFPPHHTDLFLGLLLKKIKPDDLYAELKNQLETAVRTGIRITNLSSHEHVHMAGPVLGIFIRLAKEYGIPTIRFPHGDRPAGMFEPRALYRSVILNYLAGDVRREFDKAGLKYPGHFMGFLDAGRITEDLLLRMVGSLKNGTTELVTHPGFLGPEVLERYKFHINCEAELYALTSPRVRRLIDSSGVKLVKFSEANGS